jgi:hypothetical protein
MNSGPDPDEALLNGLSASLRMLDSKLRNAEMTRRNVALDSSIKVRASRVTQ